KFTSTQLAGNVLNITGTALTNANNGRALAVTLGAQGTGIYVNTATSGFSGKLIQLRANNADQLVIDQLGNTTLGGTLAVRGASITGPLAGAFAIDNGNASAINLGNNSGAAPINIGTTNAGNVSIGRFAQTVQVNGNALSGPTTGLWTIDNGAQSLYIGNNTTASIYLGSAGYVTNVKGTLDVGNALQNQIRLQGSVATAPVVLTAAGGDTDISLNLTPKNAGRVKVTANGLDVNGTIIGPTTAAAAFTIDNGNNTGALN